MKIAIEGTFDELMKDRTQRLADAIKAQVPGNVPIAFRIRATTPKKKGKK